MRAQVARTLTNITSSTRRSGTSTVHSNRLRLLPQPKQHAISSPARRFFTSHPTNRTDIGQKSDMAESTTAKTNAEGNVCSADPKSNNDESAPRELTASEFRQYNHMADHMNMFHNSFRATWNTIYSSVGGKTTSPFTQTPLSARAIIQQGLGFCHHLTIHHTIEEQHIFPVLATKMPMFAPDATPLKQHEHIHAGLEKLEEYLEECRSGERELRREEVKERMDLFGTVLWQHLDEEVGFLGAANMSKYWSLKEMKRMPM